MTLETMELGQEKPGADEVQQIELKAAKKPSHGKEVCDQITDNGGSYDLTVKRMLQQGHEGELVTWLKDSFLIRSSMNCPNESCQGKTLAWSTARSVDKYAWCCPDCKKKQPLRENSFFHKINCDLKLCMQLIAAWCQSIPSEVVVNYLGLKDYIVRKAYEKLNKVAEAYVKNHSDEWLLGGEGKILVVDEFPGGYMTEPQTEAPTTRKRNNNYHTVLCIAEVDLEKVPPRMWMHMIQGIPQPLPLKNSKNQPLETKCGIVEEALHEIRSHAARGSYVVANRKARCCNYESLKELKDYKVISFEDLKVYDTPGKNELLSNLETIWQTGIGVCEDIQETSRANGLQYLYVHLWRQKFAAKPSDTFNYIVHHIAECFQFK